MIKKLLISALSAVAVLSTPAVAATVDFDSLPTQDIAGPLVQSGATFESSSGSLHIGDIGTGQTICAQQLTSCNGGLSVVFEGGATGVSFTFSGDADSTTELSIEGFGRVLFDGEFVPFQFLGIGFADGNPLNEQLIDFSGSSVIIDQLVMGTLDNSALVYDNFSFTLHSSAAPEPSTWALMFAGVGLAGFALRSRKPVAAAA